MREKYETLSLSVLRELAKARGLKGVSSLRKNQIIDHIHERYTRDGSLSHRRNHHGIRHAHRDRQSLFKNQWDDQPLQVFSRK